MRAYVVALAMSLSTAAAAEKIVIMPADGSADAATKGKVAAEVQKLARSAAAQVDVGDVTFSEAATAVGCTGNEAKCRDDVLGTMGVDEIVAISITALPSGDTHIVVDRIAKGTPTKTAQTTVFAGQPFEAKIQSDIGPAFGVQPPPPAPEPPPSPPPATPAPAPTPTPTLAPTEPSTAAPGPTEPGPTPMQLDNGTSLRGPIIGFAAGGALAIVGIAMWAEANSTQSSINSAPTRTLSDLQNLQNLESKGTTYAGLGNGLFIGGLVVGAVSGFFFWQHHHRAHAHPQAMLTPAVFEHGGGVAFTYGGSP